MGSCGQKQRALGVQAARQGQAFTLRRVATRRFQFEVHANVRLLAAVRAWAGQTLLRERLRAWQVAAAATAAPGLLAMRRGVRGGAPRAAAVSSSSNGLSVACAHGSRASARCVLQGRVGRSWRAGQRRATRLPLGVLSQLALRTLRPLVAHTEPFDGGAACEGNDMAGRHGPAVVAGEMCTVPRAESGKGGLSHQHTESP